MDKIQRWQKVLMVFVAGLIFCLYGFYNKFPLTFADTKAYIMKGFNGTVPLSRPIYYGLFIRHVSLNETLWLVIFAQGVLLALMILYSFKYLFHKTIPAPLFLVYVLLISTTTAISVHASMLLPDIFTPITFLAFLLLVFGKNIIKRDWWIISIVLLLSIGMHNAHFGIAFGGALLLSLGALNSKMREFYVQVGISLKRMLLLWGIIIGSNLLLSTVHYAHGGNFESGKGGSVFILARLIDMDILTDYLKNHCGSEGKDYKLCPYIKEFHLSALFLWHPKHSPFYKTGGWSNENQKECSRLVKDILTTPKYFKRYLIRCIEDSFLQLANFGVAEYTVTPDKGPLIGNTIRDKYPFYQRIFSISKQRGGHLVGSFWIIPNVLQYLIVTLSIGLLCFFFFDEKVPRRQKFIVFMLFVLIYGNALVSVASSGIYDRYQSRVNWMVTLPAFWYLWALYLRKIDNTVVVNTPALIEEDNIEETQNADSTNLETRK